MKTTKEHVTTAHANDVQWKKDLAFYKEEIGMYRKRLGEIASKNTSKEIRILVSHLESQFTIHLSVIDGIDHKINLKEDRIAEAMKENPVAFEHQTISYLSEIKGQMEVFEKLFTSLKKEFANFSSQTL